MGLVKALEHKSGKKWLRELRVFNLEKGRPQGESLSITAWEESVARWGLVSYLK